MKTRAIIPVLLFLVSVSPVRAQGGGETRSPGYAITLSSPRTFIAGFESLPLKLTVTNESKAPSMTLKRGDLVTAKSFIGAGYDRKGQWMRVESEAGSGSVDLLPGETWSTNVQLALPEAVAKNPGPVTVQWIGNGDMKDIRSNELTVSIRVEKNPVVTLETTEGPIVFELWPEKAPNHVANLVSLARAGFYDGLSFHRVISGFMIQTGCPKGDGMGDPGYKIPAEFNEETFVKGTIGMARRGDSVDSAGSQFFICVADRKDLDKQYTAFGKVLEGQDTADKISNVPRDTEHGDKPFKPVLMRKVTVATPPDYKLPEIKKVGAVAAETKKG